MGQASSQAAGAEHSAAKPIGMLVAAVGVVYGDIGTSPLYTLKEVFSGGYGVPVNHDGVLGILALIFWSLIWVVSIKYMMFVLRADNQGEGGIMALTALARRAAAGHARLRTLLVVCGLIGAALFYGDSMITPAISVLSAIEGLGLAFDGIDHWVVPISLVVLVALFLIQRHGTARIGILFGPIMVTWFLVLGALGVHGILQHPEVLQAMNPVWGVRFFIVHPGMGVAILGAVVLALTGAEALYADMGHFGRKPIRIAWLGLAMPGLVLNYFGQGALVIADPTVVHHVFFELVPQDYIIGLVILSTMAAVIASQAVITGVFSLTRQAIQLGYLPRLAIRYTSKDTIGQIYVPSINWMLLAAVIALVLAFRSSTALATAYGLSVTGTMLIDTLLLAIVAYTRWPDTRKWVLPLCGLFLVIDLAFLFANGAKLLSGIGAWVPLFIGIGAFTMMRTWRRGRELLHAEIRKEGIRLDTFLPGLMLAPPVRVPGTAVFMTADKTVVPHALMHNLKHNKVLHDRNVFLTVDTLNVPYALKEKRLSIESIGNDFYRVVIRFGFMETPDVPLALMRSCDKGGIYFDPMDTTYFASRETIVASANRGMPVWRDKLFALMHRNAASATGFFRIPGNRLVELGSQVQI